MDLILTVAQIVAPVGLLGAFGFVWVKLGYEYRMDFVTRLAMTVSVPALIFTALMKTQIEPRALTVVLFAAIAGYLLLTAVFWLFVRLFGLDRRTWLAPLIFGNTGNVGLPLALFAFGQEGLAYAVVILAVMMLWSFTFGVWLVAGAGSFKRVLKEPTMAATLLGAVFLWQGWQTPVWLTNSLDLLAQLAIPLLLITLGVAVARLSVARLGHALVMAGLRSVICFAVALAVGLGFGLPPVALAVVIVQLTTPVAVTSYMLAEKYGADAETVAGLVIASTLLSVVTLPLTLGFLI